MSTQIISRKREHVELVVGKNVAFREKTTGFERYEFIHNALPEISFEEITTDTTFLGKAISLPLMISSMTGGYAQAEQINGALAEVCASLSIPMGVGSERQAIESDLFHESFRIARQRAPNIPIIANIGAAEVAKMPTIETIERLIELVEADSLAIHCNPLQEMLQPEGTPDFSHVLEGIHRLAHVLPIPIIAKEVGAGISFHAAVKLLSAGVKIIDVAGAGGTSWAGVEILRQDDDQQELSNKFWDWGIPTSESLRDVVALKRNAPLLRVIASGGISGGSDMAKAIALGADLVGAARPFLKTLIDEGEQALEEKILSWKKELKQVMFLTGAKNVNGITRLMLKT